MCILFFERSVVCEVQCSMPQHRIYHVLFYCHTSNSIRSYPLPSYRITDTTSLYYLNSSYLIPSCPLLLYPFSSHSIPFYTLSSSLSHPIPSSLFYLILSFPSFPSHPILTYPLYPHPIPPDPNWASEGRSRGYVGAYSPAERRRRIERFLEKRRLRVWQKNVKYDVRKNFADSRIRVKGRFVKKEDQLALIAMGASPTDRNSTSDNDSDPDAEKCWSNKDESYSRDVCVSELESDTLSGHGTAQVQGPGQGPLLGGILEGGRTGTQVVVKSSPPYLAPGRSRTRANSDLQKRDIRGLGRPDNITTSI